MNKLNFHFMTLKIILGDNIVPVIKQSPIFIYTSKSVSYEMESFPVYQLSHRFN